MFKKIAINILFVVIFASCAVRKPMVTSTQQNIVSYGLKFLNTPYKFSGKNPKGFDCSGFTSFVFAKFGYNLSPSSSYQYQQTLTVARKEDLRVADLVFFEGYSQNGKVGHVGIVKEILPNGEFKFLHSSSGKGVIVSRSTEGYYAKRYLGGGRVLINNIAYSKDISVSKKTDAQVNKEISEAENQSKLAEKVSTVVIDSDINVNSSEIVEQQPDSLNLCYEQYSVKFPIYNESSSQKEGEDDENSRSLFILRMSSLLFLPVSDEVEE